MGNFYLNAFSKIEQKQIVQSTIITSDDVNCSDKIWLLDDKESKKYLKDLRAKSSNYAKELHLANNGDYSCYWLRSPGSSNDLAQDVGFGGNIYNCTNVDIAYLGVRPALWINL